MWYKSDYKNSDLEEMIEMTKEYYGNIEISNFDFIRHEYFKNPSGDAVIQLARDSSDNTLAGQYIVNPINFIINGKEVQSVLSLNTLTRDKYRGQGIFVGLAEHVYSDAKRRGYNFCYSMPNQNSYPGFIKKLKFNDIGAVPLWLRPMKPTNIVKEKLKISALSYLIKPTDLIFKPNNMKGSKYNIQRITNDNLYLIDVLWDNVKNKYKVWVKRDSKFFKWRYLEAPLRNYDIYVILANNKPVGIIVGRITTVSDMTCGMIVDFFCDSGYTQESEALLNFMIKELYDKGANLCGCLMKKNAEESKFLKNNKFYVCPKRFEPQPFRMILRRFNENYKELEVFDNWFFSMGDYDVI